MKRRIILVLVAIALLAVPAFGQLRADLGVNIPWSVGFQGSDLDGGSFSETLNVIDVLTIVLPEVSLSFVQPVGPISIGGGLRAFTFILQSFGYPYLYAEMELGPIVGQASIGGGLFPFFGFYNSIEAASIVIPDVRAYFKLGDSFRIGGGAAAAMGLETGTAAFPFLIFLSGMFVLDL